MPPTWVSKTLRLPKSKLPARAIVSDRPKYLEQVTDDLYAWQQVNGRGRFILHDGPPYANGDLHIGHALNKILKDITCRFQVSLGRKIDFRPGWDCHGLPIELKALQKHRGNGNLKDGQTLSPVEIRRDARELALSTVKLQKERFREWGVMADWNHSWKTMDKDYEIRQLELFKLLAGNGQIYRRLKPVYWSPSSKTALAEAELEYNSDHRSTAAYVKFPFHRVPQAILDLLPQESTTPALAIWTTTPWTLPANRAIAVKRNMQYVLIQSVTKELLVVGASRVAELETLRSGSIVVGHLLGKDLVGSTYDHPFRSGNVAMPIIHADFVTEDSGTGLVHIAPGHGIDDYKLCQDHGIEPFAPLDDNGNFTADALPGQDELIGKPALAEGNKAVLDLLQSKTMLISTHQYRHKYPYDWRSKQPVIIRATEQWFANLSGIKDDALRSLANVKFVPPSGYDRLSSFIKGRSEWCISRQRAWGVPIPALFDADGTAILTAESISHIISIIDDRGIDAWWSDDPADAVWVAPSLRSHGRFTRGTDTMDVWFDSGSSWTEMHPEEDSKAMTTADVYLEGSDQHRGWFQSSLLTKVAQLTALGQDAAQAPFKTLITHGFTLDHRGKKMSKSEGNVISPAQIMDGTLLPPVKRKGSKSKDRDGTTYDAMGPDALRWWVASSDFTSDLVVSIPMLQSVNSSLAKLRVTFKLLTGLLDTHNFDRSSDFKDLNALDRLAIIQSQRLRATVETAYQEFAYHRVASAINTYVNADLSAFYIESIKDRCYVDADLSKSRTRAQCVLWEIYRTLSHVLLPITPLLVAEARDYLPSQLSDYDGFKMPAGEKFASITGICQDAELEALFDWSKSFNLRSIWEQVRQLQETARTEKLMGSSLDCIVTLALPLEPADPEIQRLISRVQDMQSQLEDLLVVSKVSMISQKDPRDAIQHSAWFKHGRIDLDGKQESGSFSIDVYVHAPDNQKCIRCWKYTVKEASVPARDSDTTSNDQASTQLEDPICQRCLGVLEGQKDASPDIFDGRPNIAKAAAQCRKLKDSHVYGWNWGFKP